MTHILFIVGRCDTQAAYDDLKSGPSPYSITNYWGPRIKPTHDLLVTQWNESSRDNDLPHIPENVDAIIALATAKWGNDPFKVVGASFGGYIATLVGDKTKMPVWGLDEADPNHTDKVNTTGIPISPNVPYAKGWNRLAALTALPPKNIPYPIYSTMFTGDPAKVKNASYSINDHGYPVYLSDVIKDVLAYSFPIAIPAPVPAPVATLTLESVDARLRVVEGKLGINS